MIARALTTILTLVIFAAACGGETETNGNIFINPMDAGGNGDSGTSDAGDPVDMSVGQDASDAGTGDVGEEDGGLTACDLAGCTVSQDCVEGVCVERDPCTAALDAGTLAMDMPVTLSGSFLTSGSDAATSACGEEGQLEQLVRFEVTEQTEVFWSVDWGPQFDGLVALQTECDDPATELECSDFESGSALLEPGVYFLVLEVRLGNPGDFTVDLTAGQAPICQPGTATCSGDDRQVCVDGQTVSTQSCPLTCSGGACAGDSCSAAITVTAPGGTYSGSGTAMTSTLNYAGNTDCAEFAGMATTTPGYDVVFFLPNLLPGTVVSIDARTNDGNVNDIFIQATCGDTNQCAASYQNGEQPDFVVQTAGDYFVIIEKRQISNAPFEYSISIQ